MGANPSLMVDVMANTAMLGTGLAQAEAQVKQSANRMGTVADQMSGNFGKGLQSMLFRFAGPAFAVGVADRFARTFIKELENNRPFQTQLTNIFVDTIESLPLIGAVGTALKSGGTIPGQGIGPLQAIVNLLTRGELPVPEQLGGGVFRLGRGGGFGPATDPVMQAAQLQARIERLQGSLATNQPKTREELLSQELSRTMGGAFGSVSTAVGTFKFAQESADAQAELVRAANKQVDIMLRIQEAMTELRKLSTAN